MIKNDSSETVTVKLYQSVLSNDQTFNIGPKQKKTIFWTDNERRFVDETYECTAEIDSVELSVSNGKKLMKSMLDNNNWDKDSKGGRNSMEKCTFTITDSDLE
ncbi:MAG: hypothetical protein R2788_00575 [Saprospiraceae bacterium]